MWGPPPFKETPVPTFTPPTVEEAMGPTTGLFRFYKMTRGVAVLIRDGVATETRFPYAGDIDLADFAYLGGHDYVISDDEATMLTNLGYGDYIS